MIGALLALASAATLGLNSAIHKRSALDTSTDAYVMYDNDVIIMVTWLLAAGATYIIQSW